VEVAGPLQLLLREFLYSPQGNVTWTLFMTVSTYCGLLMLKTLLKLPPFSTDEANICILQYMMSGFCDEVY
jgi:hypothetical protein